MKKRIFTVAAFEMALFFWILESVLHYYVFEEPKFELIPSGDNELWMRVVIVFLIMLLGVFADGFISRVEQEQKKVARMYNSMLHTSRHILSNLLNQMQLFKIEALKTKDFDRDVIAYYDNAMKDASDLLETLSKVGDVTEDIEV